MNVHKFERAKDAVTYGQSRTLHNELVGHPTTFYPIIMNEPKQGEATSSLSVVANHTPRLATRFEELTIWQEARRLVQETYANFYECRDYAFRDQAQRAALSVMNNIAEGFEKSTRKDFAKYLDTAKGSSGEMRSMTYAAEDLAYLTPATASTLRARYEQLSKSIAAFTRHLRNSTKVLK